MREGDFYASSGVELEDIQFNSVSRKLQLKIVQRRCDLRNSIHRTAKTARQRKRGLGPASTSCKSSRDRHRT